MIPQNRFCNKIRELGYTFQRQADRVMVYRESGGGTKRIMVPRKANLDEDWVRVTLKMAGCAEDEIERFIATNRQTN